MYAELLYLKALPAREVALTQRTLISHGQRHVYRVSVIAPIFLLSETKQTVNRTLRNDTDLSLIIVILLHVVSPLIICALRSARGHFITCA